MSQLLLDNADFVRLLLNTSTKQQRELVKSITNSQIEALVEIFFNLNSMELKGLEARFINSKKRDFLKRVGNRKITHNTRKRKFSSGLKTMMQILSFFKSDLLKLLE